MSRSYKKTPRSGQQKSKFAKRYANRKLRRKKYTLFQHKSYRKDFCYYDICDYESIGVSFEEYWRSVRRMWYNWGHLFGKPLPTKEEAYREWWKYYKQK
jgi:hypothetical protein